MFASLWHRTIRRRNHQNRAVHLRRTRNHVFHIIGMTWAIHMGIVAIFSFIFHMRRVDRDTARFFFRCRINFVIGSVFRLASFRQNLGNSRSQRGFSMIHMTNCPNVTMWLIPFKFFFSHNSFLLWF